MSLEKAFPKTLFDEVQNRKEFVSTKLSAADRAEFVLYASLTLATYLAYTTIHKMNTPNGDSPHDSDSDQILSIGLPVFGLLTAICSFATLKRERDEVGPVVDRADQAIAKIRKDGHDVRPGSDNLYPKFVDNAYRDYARPARAIALVSGALLLGTTGLNLAAKALFLVAGGANIIADTQRESLLQGYKDCLYSLGEKDFGRTSAGRGNDNLAGSDDTPPAGNHATAVTNDSAKEYSR